MLVTKTVTNINRSLGKVRLRCAILM